MKQSDEKSGAVPAVSVIMPVYNTEKYLAEAIESLLVQTMRDFELIIVDDQSVDSTPQIMAEYARKDPRIVLLRNEKNLGGGQSRNVGLTVARAPLVVTLDGDDRSTPDRLEKEKQFLDTHPDVGAVFASRTVIDADGEVVAVVRAHWSDETMTKLLRRGCRLHHCTAMWRTEYVRQIGWYRAGLRLAEDWDMLLRFTEKWKIAVMQESLYFYRIHPVNSVSGLRPMTAAYDAVVRQLARERKSGAEQVDVVATLPDNGPASVPPGEMERCLWVLVRIAIGEGEYRNTLKYLRRYFAADRMKTLPRVVFILVAISVRATLQALGLARWFERIFQGK